MSDGRKQNTNEPNLFTFWRNGIDLVNKDDSRRVFLGLLKRFAKITLRFTSHFGHDFGTVDEEEERAGFVGHSAGHKGFSGTGGTVHENTTGRLDADSFEELWMTEGQFNQFANLGHLLPHTTDIIVTDFIKVRLLVLALDGVTL